MKKRYLSIRLNAILHLAGMFLLIATIIFITTRLVAQNSAERLDRNQALIQVQRIHDGLSLTAESIKQTTTDWSKWDETYTYIDDENPEYIDNNFYIEALESIDIDVALIYKLDGTLLFHQYNDFENGLTYDVEQEFIEQVEELDFINHTNPDLYITGLFTYDDKLYILSTAPIMPSDNTGDAVGTLIFIRIVDEHIIDTLENIVGLEFHIQSNTSLDADNPLSLSNLSNYRISVRSLLMDLNNNHDLVIDMIIPMETSIIIRDTIRLITYLSLAIMIFFLFIIIIMLDRQMFKRISTLTMQIKDIKQNQNLHLRIDTDQRQDEIKYIANEVNQMLDEIESSYNEINFLAYSDHLTGTHNRLSFYRKIEETIQSNQQSFSLFFLDLDGFKEINDKYGHETGDSVLIEVSKRIQEIIGDLGIISRAGGDEFLIYHPSIDHDELSNICIKIIDKLATCITIQKHHLEITTSIGVALYPEHGTTVQSLIRHADLAMYHAKDLGKDQFQFEIKKT
jgi:diguanylate cyclase (GGDEF)-like protein